MPADAVPPPWVAELLAELRRIADALEAGGKPRPQKKPRASAEQVHSRVRDKLRRAGALDR